MIYLHQLEMSTYIIFVVLIIKIVVFINLILLMNLKIFFIPVQEVSHLISATLFNSPYTTLINS